MQSAAAKMGTRDLVGIDVVIGDVSVLFPGNGAEFAPLLRIFLRQQGSRRHVKTDHRQRKIASEDFIGSFRILIDVCFRYGCNVARNRQSTAHQSNVADQIDDRRIFFNGSGKIGQRTGRNDQKTSLIFVSRFDEEVDA